ncbi:MAG: hypothetical protein WC141_08150 [Arcobacteraceae bacterium]
MKKIFYIAIGLIVVFLMYGLFTEMSKKKKPKRIACQEKTITFEKINSSASIKEGIELLKQKAYTLQGKIDYSVHMRSHLVNILSSEDVDLMIKKEIENYLNASNDNSIQHDKNLNINYTVYENDKEDKNKKNKDAKLYAGHIIFEFKLDNILLYKIQTDYMNLDVKDLPDRIKCAFDSFVSL